MTSYIIMALWFWFLFLKSFLQTAGNQIRAELLWSNGRKERKKDAEIT